ncbi:MAG TPA: right-handed parallel beta-helix repeat-containing protein [Thermoanaerobaculia bacterium]|nr:right-handed parallel beta-helix repeat-containing protein [Thermoanaerobaculia bacterium]
MARARSLGLAAFVAAPLAIALMADRTQSLRRDPPELRADSSIAVVSSRDAGGGTLREAITAAARTRGRVRITIAPSRITLLSPLPPVVNADGVVFDAMDSHCEIDASGIGNVPALLISSPGSAVSGLRFRNARDAAILVNAPNVFLRDVAVRDSTDGIVLTAARGTIVERASLERNTNGVRLDDTSPGTVIRGCTFRSHDGAGIWAVTGTPRGGTATRIENNTFRDDRVSVVIANLGASLTGNDIRGALENGVYTMQSRTIMRTNRILRSAGSGIVGDRVDGLVLERNEIDHNAAVGILIRSCRTASVQNNVVYANAYGIASVFGDRGAPNVIAGNVVTGNRLDGIFLIGSSPLLRGNRLLQNGAAAARVLDFVPLTGARIPSDPRFDNNTLRGNKLDAAVKGEYRPPPEKVKPQ